MAEVPAITLQWDCQLPVGNKRGQGSGKEKEDVGVQKNMEQEGACAETCNRIAFGDGELLFKIHMGTKGQSHSSPRQDSLYMYIQHWVSILQCISKQKQCLPKALNPRSKVAEFKYIFLEHLFGFEMY